MLNDKLNIIYVDDSMPNNNIEFNFREMTEEENDDYEKEMSEKYGMPFEQALEELERVALSILEQG